MRGSALSNSPQMRNLSSRDNSFDKEVFQEELKSLLRVYLISNIQWCAKFLSRKNIIRTSNISYEFE